MRNLMQLQPAVANSYRKCQRFNIQAIEQLVDELNLSFLFVCYRPEAVIMRANPCTAFLLPLVDWFLLRTAIGKWAKEGNYY